MRATAPSTTTIRRTAAVRTAAAVTAAALWGLVLTGCAASAPPVIAPVTMAAGDLQGETVQLDVGQVLNITTGDLAVDSYTGEVADESIAEFSPGREEDGATFDPGVTALAAGTTSVVLSNADGGIQDVTFTVVVSDD